MGRGSKQAAPWELPESARPWVDRALREPNLERASEAARDALRAVRFPLVKQHELGVCLPSELDDAQKAIALALSARDELEIERFALARGQATVRRWLGLDPPTALEEVITYVDDQSKTSRTEPRWARYLRQSNPTLDDLRPVDAVSTLEAAVELLSPSYGIRPPPGFITPISRAVGAKALPLAQRYLAQWSARLEACTDMHTKRELVYQKGFIQHAFVAADAPFDERIAPFLALRECTEEEMLALVRWLPEERRDAIVLGLLQSDPIWRVRNGAKILGEFALRETAAYVAEQHCKDRPDSQSPASVKKKTGELIEVAAKKHKSIADALAPALSPAARKALGIKVAKSAAPKEEPAPEWKPLPAKAPLADRVGNFIDGLDAGCLKGKGANALRKEGLALMDAMFRKTPTVCRRPSSLSEMERAFLAKYIEHFQNPSLLDAGLWDHGPDMLRALGDAPASIQDVELEINGDRAPAWCFLREHLNSDAPSQRSLIEAVMKLEEEQRFELFASLFIRKGKLREFYSFWQGVKRLDYGAPLNQQPPPGPHRARLCRFTAALALAIGPRAEQLATASAFDIDELEYPGLLEGALAFATLEAFAHSRGQSLDPRWNAALTTITDFADVKRDPALLASILDAPEPEPISTNATEAPTKGQTKGKTKGKS